MMRKFKTKSELMREKIHSVSEHYGMHADFQGGMVYITTIVGKWFFDYNDRPITLRHKNAKTRFDKHGRSKGYYHQQKNTFNSPFAALTYIRNHERAEMRRVMNQTFESITLYELLCQTNIHAIIHFLELEYGMMAVDELSLCGIYDELLAIAPMKEMQESIIIVACVHNSGLGTERRFESSYMLLGDEFPRAIKTTTLNALLTMNICQTSIELYGSVAVASSILYTSWTPANSDDDIKKSYLENEQVYSVITNNILNKGFPAKLLMNVFSFALQISM